MDRESLEEKSIKFNTIALKGLNAGQELYDCYINDKIKDDETFFEYVSSKDDCVSKLYTQLYLDKKKNIKNFVLMDDDWNLIANIIMFLHH